MNKMSKLKTLILGGVMFFAAAPLVRAQAPSNPRNSRGEQFFIISSVDQQKHQVVLMAPTQLTLVAALTPQTICLSEQGQQIDAKQIKAGDTVWVTLRTTGGETSAVRIREGAMTPAEMRALYLHSLSGMNTPPPAPARQPGAKPGAPSAPKPPSASAPASQTGSATGPGTRRPGERRHHRPGEGQ